MKKERDNKENSCRYGELPQTGAMVPGHDLSGFYNPGVVRVDLTGRIGNPENNIGIPAIGIFHL